MTFGRWKENKLITHGILLYCTAELQRTHIKYPKVWTETDMDICPIEIRR